MNVDQVQRTLRGRIVRATPGGALLHRMDLARRFLGDPTRRRPPRDRRSRPRA